MSRFAGLNAPIFVRERVADLPMPAGDSVKQECEICDCEVWQDLMTAWHPLAESGSVVCMRCMLARLEEDVVE